MQLLIITQKISQRDPILGFFHNWLKKFAANLDRVKVICLEKGSVNLPDNVEIKSLGKEIGTSRLARFLRLLKISWHWRCDYTHVFVHMNTEYIIIAGWWWRLTGKKIFLWYAHKHVSWRLRVAEKFCNAIFTSSTQGFRLPSTKTIVVGQGIDTELFKPLDTPKENLIICVGRISPTKGQLDLIKTLQSVLQEQPDLKLALIGTPVYEQDKKYLDRIKTYIEENRLQGRVQLVGAVLNFDLPTWYNRAKLLVNISQTGSLDKDILEAMACDLPALTTNQAFVGTLPANQITANLDELADKVRQFTQQPPAFDYRATILAKHNLDNLIKNLVSQIDVA